MNPEMMEIFIGKIDEALASDDPIEARVVLRLIRPTLQVELEEYRQLFPAGCAEGVSA